MKKYLVFIFLIFSLLFPVQNVFAESDKQELVNCFGNELLNLKEMCNNDKDELINKLKIETNEDVKKDLVSQIEKLMILTDADFNVKDVYTSGDKTKYVVEISHQGNLANWMNYNSRLKEAKELCMQRDENEPYDLELNCFKETLDLCKNKRTNCTVEFESGEEESKLSLSSYASILKSMIF